MVKFGGGGVFERWLFSSEQILGSLFWKSSEVMAFRLELVLFALLLSLVVDSVHSDDGEPCSCWLLGIYRKQRRK